MTEVYTIEQARELALLSRATDRQTGLLIDRKGRVCMVLVGTATGIFIPDLPRVRAGIDRLRGLRLLHTHLTPEGVTTEDIMDMLFLRLDAVIALTVNQEGFPLQWQSAHLLPCRPADEPWFVEKPRPWDRTEARFTELAESLEAEFARQTGDGIETPGLRRALLVSVNTAPHSIQKRNLDELTSLAQTAGIAVAGRIIQRAQRANPGLLPGKGKLAQLEIAALQARAHLLIFDGELTPAQLHTLADSTEREVIDRTQLILNIFARHATTKTGKLQVELAQLRYLRPRLAGRKKNMDSLMGGIGGRGPGETKLETDRRRSRERATRIRHELEQIKLRQNIAKKRRARSSVPVIALVGYTNAGKTTLLNALTRSRCLVEDKLFATLDPVARRMRFPEERPLIVVDTVGFIRDLPVELKEAFQATLEGLRDADMLVHMADASHPDVLRQIAAVEDILADPEMGLQAKPALLLLNKWDALEPAAKAELADNLPQALRLSAKTGEGFGALLQEVDRQLAFSRQCRILNA
ncbi:MAG: GTPase HflX [Desulfovibrio sp.]|jgi:GTP-binding protein HflX|nr:GTPase HflX [Desulfovibrio sp.]